MILILTTFLFAVIIAGTTYANGLTDVYVSPEGDDDTGTGQASDPFRTVGKGIDSISSGGTVNLAPGTYDRGGGGVTKDYGIEITKDVTIQGAGKDLTFIDARGLDGIFTIASGCSVILKDLTLMNGQPRGNGGAVNVASGSTLNAINCKFIKNKATSGGAIYNLGSTTATNCLFENNEAGFTQSGGAIYTTCGSVLTVTGSTFTGNKDNAQHGGAIFASGSVTLKIIGNNFINNMGNAIYIIYLEYAHYNINVNRIVANTPYGLYISRENPNQVLGPAGGEIKIDASNNWWGSNNDPRTVDGTIYDPQKFADTTKWLVLGISAYPNSVPFGGTSTVTANVIYNNLGQDTSSIGHIPDGTPITITTDIGNVGSKSVVRYTVNGIVSTIFRANDGLGIANLNAILDNFMTPLPALVEVAAGSVGTKASVSAKTIGMQETGTALIPLLLGLLFVSMGAFTSKQR